MYTEKYKNAHCGFRHNHCIYVYQMFPYILFEGCSRWHRGIQKRMIAIALCGSECPLFHQALPQSKRQHTCSEVKHFTEITNAIKMQKQQTMLWLWHILSNVLLNNQKELLNSVKKYRALHVEMCAV